MKRENITIDDIRSKYHEEKGISAKNLIWDYYILRRISYYPSWLFLRLGVSANEVTGIAIIIGFVGCIFLAFGNYSGMIAGALILNIWALFDYIDGNVARATNSCSSYGGFLDDFNTYLISVLFFISAGIGVFNHPDTFMKFLGFSFLSIDKSIFLFLGGWTSVFCLFTRFLPVKFEKVFSQDRVDFAAELKVNTFIRFLYKIGSNMINLVGIVMPILLFATIFKFLSFFIILYALITTCAFIVLTIQIVRRAKSINDQKFISNKL